jgi:hypothetical protein
VWCYGSPIVEAVLERMEWKMATKVFETKKSGHSRQGGRIKKAIIAMMTVIGIGGASYGGYYLYKSSGQESSRNLTSNRNVVNESPKNNSSNFNFLGMQSKQKSTPLKVHNSPKSSKKIAKKSSLKKGTKKFAKKHKKQKGKTVAKHKIKKHGKHLAMHKKKSGKHFVKHTKSKSKHNVKKTKKHHSIKTASK